MSNYFNRAIDFSEASQKIRRGEETMSGIWIIGGKWYWRMHMEGGIAFSEAFKESKEFKESLKKNIN